MRFIDDSHYSKPVTIVLEQSITEKGDIILTDDQLDNCVNTSQALTLTSIQLPSNICASRNKNTQK